MFHQSASGVVSPTPLGLEVEGGAGLSRRATVKDVAALAGVTHASVSVVLNGASGNTRVSDETRQRILEAAQQLGYKRNGSLVSARTGRFGALALLLSTINQRSNLPQKMWSGIQDELDANDMSLTLARLPEEELAPDATVPKVLREMTADGFLVNYTNHIPPKLLQLIHGHSAPAIWLNAQHERDCVYPNDFAAGAQVTRRLLELGHQKIAYMDASHREDDAGEHYSALARREGFESAMREAALPARAVWLAHPFENQAAQLEAILGAADAPTAFVGYGRAEAEVLWLVAAKLGLQIPRDVSYVTFESDVLRVGGLELSCALVPEYEMGRQATRLLLQKIGAPSQEWEPLVLPFAFHAGQSLAPTKKP